jgi:hypothetical protein
VPYVNVAVFYGRKAARLYFGPQKRQEREIESHKRR